MNRIIFILKRLKNFNFKAMIKTARKISKKIKKPFIIIFIDIVSCMVKYQAGYNDYLEFEFYLLNKEQRKTYLTAGINNNIIKKYNKKEYWHVLDDKVEFNYTFSKYLNREWLDLRKAKEDEFKEFVEKHPVVMVKPLDDCGGNGVEKIEIEDSAKYKELYNKLKENGQVLVEEFIYQHEKMNELYNKSVNTLRLFTILKEDKAYYLQGILRIGNGGNVDNFSSGGMYTFVNNEGQVIVPAIDKEDLVYEVHPISNIKIVGFEIPFFNEAKELVENAAKEIPQVAYIGWDVAITKDGPVIIEGNCYPGVFQIRPSFLEKKEGILPVYEKYMDIEK